MINNYKIKHIDGEEILYLYFSFDDDFANIKNDKKSLKRIIDKYIKDKKILFKGITVAVVVGGVVLCTISMNEREKMSNLVVNQPYQIKSIIDTDLELKKVSEIKITEEKKEPEKKVAEKNTQTKTTTTKKVDYKKTTNKNKEVVTEPKTATTVSKETKTTKATEPVKESITVKVYRKNGEVLTLGLEEYVLGVVGAEMPASFHIEALKAQAVIARTYALNSLDNNRKLTDNSSTQNYKSNAELKKMWGNSYDTYYKKIKNAVDITKGEYLTYNGKAIEALYHSTSNGKTENAKYVWGKSLPYLVSVSSPYDEGNPSYSSTKFITYEKLSNIFSIDINVDSLIEIIDYTDGDRVNNIKISDKKFTGVEIRTLLGLRSADFKIQKQENGILFTTNGYGHGVGLSQYGANGFAKSGYNYKKILNHYYSNVTLKQK